VKKQNVWLWGNLAIYETDPAVSSTAVKASHAVSQLTQVALLHAAGA
jgi:hypothetical protein